MTGAMYQSFWEQGDSTRGKSAPFTTVHRDEDGDIVMRFGEDGCDFAVVQTGAQFRAFAAQVAAMVVEMDATVSDGVEVAK